MKKIEPGEDRRYTYENLLEVMAILRSENGCPWDREQDHKSLAFSTIEEAYELVEAINNEDMDNLREELGDVLLQVVFHSQIAKEDGRFDMTDVTHGITSKLIHRHPHVFSDTSVENSEEVLKNWDEIKLKEKAISSTTEDVKKVPKALPSLIRAAKVQKKVAKVGFEFDEIGQVWGKVEEEMLEVKEAILAQDQDHVDEEFGDLLFSIVNLSRFLRVNPENALTNAVEKFINRFEGVENLAKSREMRLSELSLEELDALWDEVKMFNSR